MGKQPTWGALITHPRSRSPGSRHDHHNAGHVSGSYIAPAQPTCPGAGTEIVV